MTNLTGILKHWEKSIIHDPPRITVTILVSFKGGLCENYHLLLIVTRAQTGTENKQWIGRLLDLYKFSLISTGPLFRNTRCLKIRANDMKPCFFDNLEQVQALRADLISPSEEFVDDYGIYRSLRRGYTSEVTNQGLP